MCSCGVPPDFLTTYGILRYTIGQRIAKDFSAKDRIFLCGDAAHTHSSGAAQGLNTGIHDAVNLAWKLALQVRGIAGPDVLRTYAPERMTAVQKLIDYDRDIATLMSHKWPCWYEGDRAADPYLLLGEIFERAASFNTGLGIAYPENAVNQVGKAVRLAVAPGSRPPDVELTAPGTNRGVRFQRITRNFARFWVVVCTGDVAITRDALMGLRAFLEEEASEIVGHEAIGWLTICPLVACSPYEAVGMKPFGDTYFDPGRLAHEKFGIDMGKGAVLILRPDGLLGTACSLEGGGIKEYFHKILKI